MPRRPRLDPNDGWHHVMNRGAARADVFHSDSDRIEFGARLADIHDDFGVETHAYCLLGNHYHLVLHCPFGGLSAAMQQLSSLYTRHVNDRVGRDGPLFRGRFTSRLITDDRYLLAAVRYVHRNALDLAGVDRCDEYRWSSHRAYLGHRRCPPWMRTDRVLSQFASVSDFAEFVEGGRPGPGRSLGRPVAEFVDAAEFVALSTGVGEPGTAAALARAAAIAWLDTTGDACDEVLIRSLGLATSTACRMARSRARRRLCSDPDFRGVVRRAAALVGVTAGV